MIRNYGKFYQQISQFSDRFSCERVLTCFFACRYKNRKLMVERKRYRKHSTNVNSANGGLGRCSRNFEIVNKSVQEGPGVAAGVGHAGRANFNFWYFPFGLGWPWVAACAVTCLWSERIIGGRKWRRWETGADLYASFYFGTSLNIVTGISRGFRSFKIMPVHCSIYKHNW